MTAAGAGLGPRFHHQGSFDLSRNQAGWEKAEDPTIRQPSDRTLESEWDDDVIDGQALIYLSPSHPLSTISQHTRWP